MLGADVEHVMGLGNAADHGAGDGATTADQVVNRRRGMAVLRHADQDQHAVALEQACVGVQIMAGRDGVQNHIKRAGLRLHF
ncbi:hypothetical protein D3C80_2030410 [compost metagenome]